MTLQELFEENRERIKGAVAGADAAGAVRALNAELDRILYAFNDREENAQVREAAGSMIQVAKAACALADSAGETKIYGRTEYGVTAPADRGRVSRWGLVLLLLGLICAAGAIGAGQIALSAAAEAQAAGLPPRWLPAGATAASAFLLFFAGMLLRRRKEAAKETLHAETTVDPSLVYTRLLTVILVIDKQLEEIRSAAGLAERARLKEQAAGMDPAELELLSRLLEDAYGRKGADEQAEEEISQIRFYLHRKNIDVVDWTPDTAGQGAWFDMMPAYDSGTFRPALIADGTLLKKGMASAGRG